MKKFIPGKFQINELLFGMWNDWKNSVVEVFAANTGRKDHSTDRQKEYPENLDAERVQVKRATLKWTTQRKTKGEYDKEKSKSRRQVQINLSGDRQKRETS